MNNRQRTQSWSKEISHRLRWCWAKNKSGPKEHIHVTLVCLSCMFGWCHDWCLHMSSHFTSGCELPSAKQVWAQGACPCFTNTLITTTGFLGGPKQMISCTKTTWKTQSIKEKTPWYQQQLFLEVLNRWSHVLRQPENPKNQRDWEAEGGDPWQELSWHQIQPVTWHHATHRPEIEELELEVQEIKPKTLHHVT